jgi:uncharacterized phage-associated protein
MNSIFNIAKCLIYIDNLKDGSEGISNLKLQKLCYYAQGLYLAINSAPLSILL